MMWSRDSVTSLVTLVFVCIRLNDASSINQPPVTMATHHNHARDCRTNESQSFLWTVRRDANHPASFLFGTIHVPYSRVWEFIPDNVKIAFQRAHRVYFELDLSDSHTISELSSCQLLPGNQTLADILPRQLYDRLRAHLEHIRIFMATWLSGTHALKGSRNIYADYLFTAITANWQRKRPIWIMLMINSLTESEVRSREVPVLDLYLAQEAAILNKMAGAVETPADQCQPLNDLSPAQAEYALDYTLRLHEMGRNLGQSQGYGVDDLIRHYNCGDLKALQFNYDQSQVLGGVGDDVSGSSSLVTSEAKMAADINSYLRDRLIHARNERLAESTARFLDNEPRLSFFFAFGAGHFFGNNSVIDQLRSRGFVIERMHAQHFDKDKHRSHRSKQQQAKQKSTHRGHGRGKKRVVHLPVIDSSSTSDVRAKPVDSKHLKSPTFNELWIKVKPDTAELISSIKVEFHSSATTLGSQHSTNVWFPFVTILFLILTGQ